jgi:hypothetical protein
MRIHGLHHMRRAGMSVAAISCSGPVIFPVPACYFAVIFDRSAGFMRLSDEFAFRPPRLQGFTG